VQAYAQLLAVRPDLVAAARASLAGPLRNVILAIEPATVE